MLIESLFVALIVLAAIVSAPAVTQALERPGKMRLSEAEYRIDQRTHSAGFTLAAIAEGLAALVTFALLLLVPARSVEFWLLAVALAGFIVIQAAFWLLLQPIHRAWFAVGGQRLHRFEQLRARWECTHLVRAAVSVFSLIAVAIATTANVHATSAAIDRAR